MERKEVIVCYTGSYVTYLQYICYELRTYSITYAYISTYEWFDKQTHILCMQLKNREDSMIEILYNAHLQNITMRCG